MIGVIEKMKSNDQSVSRRDFISQVMAVGALSAWPLSLWGADAKKEKYNVLFIGLDDLKPLIGAYGNPHIKTPHMDRLAKNGLTFTNCHCQQALCAPSRASLLTGLRPDTTGVVTLQTYFRETAPQAISLPQIFKENGWTTVALGKIFHTEEKKETGLSWSEPWHHGNDSSLYVDPDNVKTIEAAIAQSGASTPKEITAARAKYARFGPACESPDLPDSAFPDGQCAERLVARLEKFAETKEPFFLSAGFIKPHLPFSAPKKYWDLYEREKIELPAWMKVPDGGPALALHDFAELRAYRDIHKTDAIEDAKAKELIHGYYACMSFVDAQVGKLLDALDRLNLAQNTIVVLWGDHGFHLGDHGLWSKMTNFEQATRAPLIISHPGMKGKGARCSAPAEFVDIYPTLCELAGIERPKILEGDSMVRLLNNPKASWKTAAFSQFQRDQVEGCPGGVMGYSMRTERYRYTEWVTNDGWNLKNKEKPVWKHPALGNRVVATEFYDYQKDPMETRNLINAPEYRQELEKHQKMMASGWRGIRQGIGKK